MARGRKKESDSLRTQGIYRPAIRAEFKTLIEAISASRNWSTQHTVEQALIRLATVDEADAAGLVE